MFDTIEKSRFGGRPVRLFVFTRQALTWRFASSDRDVVVGGQTYLAAQIDRDEIKQTVERAKDKVKIRIAYLRDPSAVDVPSTQSLGDNWHPYTPSDTIFVTCMAYHYGDDAAAVEWLGQVMQPSFTDVELELTCEPGKAISEALNQGPKWQRACWKTVYSTGVRGCNLDPTLFEIPAEVTAITGLQITAEEFATAPLSLAGGDVKWTRADGLVERRSIMAHDGDTIQILYNGPELEVGTSVVVKPGCPQTWAECVLRNNTINYGGAIYKPVSSPLDGESMSWD